MKSMGLYHSAWSVSFKMVLRGRHDRLDQLGGPHDESDEMHLMKITGLAHSAWRVGSNIACRVRLGRLDWSGGTNGYRAV